MSNALVLKPSPRSYIASHAMQVGTTAVVALVGDRQLYIGNCGAFLVLAHVSIDALGLHTAVIVSACTAHILCLSK